MGAPAPTLAAEDLNAAVVLPQQRALLSCYRACEPVSMLQGAPISRSAGCTETFLTLFGSSSVTKIGFESGCARAV